MKESRLLALSLILLMLFNFVLFDVHIFSHLYDIKYVSNSVEIDSQNQKEQNQHCALCDLFHSLDKQYIKSDIKTFFFSKSNRYNVSISKNIISIPILHHSSRAPPQI